MMKYSTFTSIWIAVQLITTCAAFRNGNIRNTAIFNRHDSVPQISVSSPPTLKALHNTLVRPNQSPLAIPRTVPTLYMGDADASSTSDGDDAESSSGDEASAAAITEEASGFKKFRQRLFPPKEDDDGLTFRQKLAKMGLSVVLSYGWVSNMSYSITVSLAWFISSKRTGLSPLAKGQWKPFLGVYAGFYLFNNVIRPFRIALSVGVARYFDNIVKVFQDKFKVSKGWAIGITVFFANVVGTCAAMAAGIALASLASGVPIFP